MKLRTEATFEDALSFAAELIRIPGLPGHEGDVARRVRDEMESLGFEEIASYLVAGDTESRCEPDPQNHDLYQEMISRQQYLVDTLHPAGFL